MTAEPAEPVEALDAAPVRCVRRPLAVWTTCGCPACVLDRARLRRRVYLGQHTRIPPEQAWAVIDLWWSRAWTPAAMASATGLTSPFFRALAIEVADGHRRRFGPETTRRIVEHTEPTVGRVGAVGTARRIRALVRAGHTVTSLAAMSTVAPTTFSYVAAGHGRWVSVAVAREIGALFAAVDGTPGPDPWTATRAADRGWAPSSAWYGVDIDDPTAQALGYRYADRKGALQPAKARRRSKSRRSQPSGARLIAV